MTDTMTRKKTGPKPKYGAAKTMVSFRLSPGALDIIKSVANEKGISQAEVLEQWSRQFKDSLQQEPVAASNAISLQRDMVASER